MHTIAVAIKILLGLTDGRDISGQDVKVDHLHSLVTDPADTLTSGKLTVM